MEKTPITKAECLATNKIVMEKLDNLNKNVTDILVSVASLPGDLAKEFDQRYAGKKTEEKLEELENKLEGRNYEWLKYFATALITAGITFLVTR